MTAAVADCSKLLLAAAQCLETAGSLSSAPLRSRALATSRTGALVCLNGPAVRCWQQSGSDPLDRAPRLPHLKLAHLHKLQQRGEPL